MCECSQAYRVGALIFERSAWESRPMHSKFEVTGKLRVIVRTRIREIVTKCHAST